AQVAASIAPKLIERLNFNLSQFRTPLELIAAFHKVRDLSLEGKIPLVFFDEFDSTFEEKLGWLKYFLSPMQDGVFREGDSLHSIGKTIFVFAGGTSNTLQTFCGEKITDKQEKKRFLQEFKLAKGPDFLSRLRGYVNILGPNQTDPVTDQLFIIRRAMLLRSLLEKKVPHLITDGEAQIDNGVLRALLKIAKYKHESRSMEAILDMSLLTKAKKWEQSYLPSKEQLKLHVDEETFLRHLMHDTFYSEKIENLSIAIHEKFRELNEHNPYISEKHIKPWHELGDDIKNFTREQAKHIPDALMKISYDVVSVKDNPDILEFTEEELNILAAYEHSYWFQYKKSNGWKRGDVIDWERKTDPDLLRWEVLSPDKKYNVYKMVKSWPQMLANANFKLEQLRFAEESIK
ncbi:MAG: Ryanodine receptor Ryr, partial [Pelosinus sp.]|nr:Ryanodine receptor Ryr [Pelosinus sp.]